MTLAVTDAAIGRAAERLTNGGWQYSRRQLYYAVCAEVEIPPNSASATGQAGLGVLLLLLGVILYRIRPVGYVLMVLGAVLVLAGLTSRMRRPPVRSRLLALSYGDFLRRIQGLQLRGLLPEAAPAPAPHDGNSVVVVCDTNETASIVAGNFGTAGMEPLPIVCAESVLRPLHVAAAVCLHDASPAGCALVAEIHDQGLRVIDAGLRPHDLGADHTEQLHEGAPARMPRDLSAVLSQAEIEWLMSGRRVELATRTSAEIMAMLGRALQLSAQRVEQANASTEAQH